MVIQLLVSSLLLGSFSSLNTSEPVTIGCVLPLSGKFGAFGNKTLQGIELAVEKHNAARTETQRPVKLIIKDSKGMPDQASKAVFELDRAGVSSIIGPILSLTADSAARKAQELEIPIITLTQKDNITETGDYVFRNCITNEAQVRGLVDYAIRNSLNRIAILYPDNAYGNDVAGLFVKEFVSAGGNIAAARNYGERQTDFGAEIKGIAGEEFLAAMKIYHQEREREFREAEKAGQKPKKGKLKEPPAEDERLQKPKPPFDAVFIADYADTVGLMVPQLTYYDVTGVKLLGLSGWNSPKLIKLAGEFLSDAVFVDGFFSGSGRPHVKEFVDSYRNIFGEDPGILAAQAYDTANILISVISSTGGDREWIRRAIGRIESYRGVSGDITFKGRDADRTVFMLTVRERRIEEIEVQ